MSVDGIVYLSPRRSRQVTLPHLYADLCKLLPPKTAELLWTRVPKPPGDPGRRQDAGPAGGLSRRTHRGAAGQLRGVVDAETGELTRPASWTRPCARCWSAPPHGVKVHHHDAGSRRVRCCSRSRGARPASTLDEGLASPYAENILRAHGRRRQARPAGMHPSALLATARERTRGYPRALEALAAILSTDRRHHPRRAAGGRRAPAAGAGGRGAGRRGLQPPRPAGPAGDAGARRLCRAGAAGGGGLSAAALPCRASTAPRCCGRLVNMQFARARGRALLPAPGRPRLRPGADPRGSAGRPGRRAAALHPLCAARTGPPTYFQETRTARASWKTRRRPGPPARGIRVRIAGQEYDAAARCCSRSTSTTCCYGAMRGLPSSCTNA